MNNMRGTDMVIIGLLAYLLWKEFNPEPVTLSTVDTGINNVNGGSGFNNTNLRCLPSGVPNSAEPVSSMKGPAWTYRAQR